MIGWTTTIPVRNDIQPAHSFMIFKIVAALLLLGLVVYLLTVSSMLIACILGSLAFAGLLVWFAL